MKKIEKSVTRKRMTTRGGGVEISLANYGYYGEFMSAYQNYLGGGMLGSIQNDCTIKDWEDNRKLTRLAEVLRKMYADETNQELEWTDSLPSSAY